MAPEPAPRPPRWTRLERDERREQILTCARRLFRERHYSAVSTAEIAHEAGVARGLLHHYFGTKRDLYLEVVREMVRVPPPPPPEDLEGLGAAEAAATAMDNWLEMVARNRETWLAALGAEGFGRDAEVEAVLDDAREAAAERLIVVLGRGPVAAAPVELRALVRAFSGLAENATREWLERRRLTRAQVHRLLTDVILHMVDDVLPRVVEAGAGGGTKR